jgi:hypothetical protein
MDALTSLVDVSTEKVMELVGVELAEKQKDDETRRQALRDWQKKLDTNLSTSSSNSSGSVAAAMANRKKQRESAKQHKPGADKEESVSSKKVSPTKKASSRIIKLLGKSKEEANTVGEEPLPSPKRRSASLSSPPRQHIEPRVPPVPAEAKTRSGSICAPSSASSSLIGPMMKKKTGSLVEPPTAGRDAAADASTSPTTERKKKRGSWLLGRAVDAPEQPKSPVHFPTRRACVRVMSADVGECVCGGIGTRAAVGRPGGASIVPEGASGAGLPTRRCEQREQPAAAEERGGAGLHQERHVRPVVRAPRGRSHAMRDLPCSPRATDRLTRKSVGRVCGSSGHSLRLCVMYCERGNVYCNE